MCGRYLVTSPPEAMRRLFGTQGVLPNFPPRYNVAPTQDVPVVFVEHERRVLALMRWGLVPAGSESDAQSKPRPGRPPLINARSETVGGAGPFRNAYRARRCLVPADGYYEWDKTSTTPHLFRRRSGFPPAPAGGGGEGALFAFAGLWEEWQDPKRPDIAPLRSCTVLTTRPSELVAPLHDRMPVILPPESWAVWLGEAKADHAELQAVLASASATGFTDTTVSKHVNAHGNDDPACIEPASDVVPIPPSPRDSGRLL
ncbi:MAG: SOS response-associated peptidase [Alphaproteobacteria bacterium]|nr:SOS response-associated peptidase [Alphaproteobacteria bacterium]